MKAMGMTLIAFLLQKNMKGEIEMLKKLRQRYWYLRDRGKAGIFKMICFFTVLTAVGGIAFGTKDIWFGYLGLPETEVMSDAVSGEAVSGSIASDVATSTPIVVSASPSPSPNALQVVDTSGLSGYLAYMSDDAYERLKTMVAEKCVSIGVKTARKLDYQTTGNTEYDVVGYIVLSEGAYADAMQIVECDYNLKGDTVSLADSTYTEAEIEQMKVEADEAEDAEIAAKDKAKDSDKSKKSKKKNAKSKKSKSKKSRKKSTGKSKSRKSSGKAKTKTVLKVKVKKKS